MRSSSNHNRNKASSSVRDRYGFSFMLHSTGCKNPYKRNPDDPRFRRKPTETLADRICSPSHQYTFARAEPTTPRASLRTTTAVGAFTITEEPLEATLTVNKPWLSRVIAASHREVIPRRVEPRVRIPFVSASF
jgi:hypothetical protein